MGNGFGRASSGFCTVENYGYDFPGQKADTVVREEIFRRERDYPGDHFDDKTTVNGQARCSQARHPVVESTPAAITGKTVQAGKEGGDAPFLRSKKHPIAFDQNKGMLRQVGCGRIIHFYW